jgi:hypothetical protein
LDTTFDNITYTDYFKKFVLYKASPEDLRSPNVFVEQIIGNCPVNKVSPRQVGLKVTRIQMISPTAGELFYLRALLLHRPARSYEGLRTIDGTVYTTFHEAAVLFGLFSNENEAQFALHEGVLCLITAHQLRFLFARVVLEGYPAAVLWDEFKLHLAADFIARTRSQDEGLNTALQRISQSVREGGRRLSHFGLPEPELNAHEKTVERETFSSRADQLRDTASQQVNSMNAEQREVFSTIVDCTTTFRRTRSTGNSPFFLEGKPGRGKTFVINAVANHLRARAHIVLIVGSSALAATLYEGGRTAHNLFQIPVMEVRKLLTAFVDPSLNLHSRRETLQFNRRFARFQSGQSSLKQHHSSFGMNCQRQTSRGSTVLMKHARQLREGHFLLVQFHLWELGISDRSHRSSKQEEKQLRNWPQYNHPIYGRSSQFFDCIRLSEAHKTLNTQILSIK